MNKQRKLVIESGLSNLADTIYVDKALSENEVNRQWPDIAYSFVISSLAENQLSDILTDEDKDYIRHYCVIRG